MVRSIVLLGAVVLTACPEIPEGRFACEQDADCPSSFRCDLDDNRCYSVFVDSGECEPGSRPSRLGCVDVDECATSGVCGPDSTCTNTAPGFLCACGDGAVLSAETGLCEDVNECELITHDCSPRASCTNTAGGFDCTCHPLFTGDGRTCAPSCTPGTDTDTGMRAITVTHIDIPDFQVFDFDGVNNATTANGGLGRTYPGCFVLDAPGGFENNYGALASVFEDAFGSALPGVLSQGVQIAISRLGTGEMDACVGVVLTIGTRSHTGTARLENHVLEVAFSQPIELDTQLPASDCGAEPSPCPSPLRVTLLGGRARLLLDETNSTVLPGSAFGGILYLGADANDTSLSTVHGAITAWASQTGDTQLASNMRLAFESSADLRLDPVTGRIIPCTQNGPNPQDTDANALSATISFDSL